jgi:hypothetical protein
MLSALNIKRLTSYQLVRLIAGFSRLVACGTWKTRTSMCAGRVVGWPEISMSFGWCPLRGRMCPLRTEAISATHSSVGWRPIVSATSWILLGRSSRRPWRRQGRQVTTTCPPGPDPVGDRGEVLVELDQDVAGIAGWCVAQAGEPVVGQDQPVGQCQTGQCGDPAQSP